MGSTTRLIPILVLLISLLQFIHGQEFDCVINKTQDRGVCVKSYSECSTYQFNYRTYRDACEDRKDANFCCPFKEQFKVTGKRARAMCYFYHTTYNGFPSFGGLKASSKEFPHMAALAYQNGNSLTWGCGGSLISNQYVLTAAHCLFSPEFGPVKIARLGDLDLNADSDEGFPVDFPVLEAIPHPKYKRPSHYHDIGLIRIREVKFNPYYKPACLHTYRQIPAGNYTATGWGKTDFIGGENSHLLKVYLNLVPHNVCQQRYATASPRRLANGIDEYTQFCAGHPNGNDPCPGDSGGPFQIGQPLNWDVFLKDHHEIIGITSFGKGCGQENSAGVYTRVAAYIRWIENIVWPV